MDIDVVVVLVYFGFLLGIGWMFRDASSSTSDYFRGGGKMLWWMVGSTAFMTALSAMTFTGVMDQDHKHAAKRPPRSAGSVARRQ